MTKKIYLSPERRPAPHGKYAIGGVYEHDVCCEIAAFEKTALERCGFNVVIAAPASSLEERVYWANANGVNYYQCIHSNAGGGTGAECLYYNHPESKKANQLVYGELVKLYPSKRGLKDYSNFYENANTKMVSVIRRSLSTTIPPTLSSLLTIKRISRKPSRKAYAPISALRMFPRPKAPRPTVCARKTKSLNRTR